MSCRCIQISHADSFICSATSFFNSSREAQEEILHYYEWTFYNFTSNDIYFKFYKKENYWERSPDYFGFEEDLKNE